MTKDDLEVPNPENPNRHFSDRDDVTNIPLPTSKFDVEEIEIPGLARIIYDEGEERLEESAFRKPRLNRMRSSILLMPGSFERESTDDVHDVTNTHRPAINRQRSNSVPSNSTLPWDWLPSYLRRALIKFADMSDEEQIKWAASLPLPDDKNISGAELALDAASIPLSDDDETTLFEAPLSKTPGETHAVDDHYVHVSQVVNSMQNGPQSENTDIKSLVPFSQPNTIHESLLDRDADLQQTRPSSATFFEAPVLEASVPSQASQKKTSNDGVTSHGGLVSTSGNSAAVENLSTTTEKEKSTKDLGIEDSLDDQCKDGYDSNRLDMVKPDGATSHLAINGNAAVESISSGQFVPTLEDTKQESSEKQKSTVSSKTILLGKEQTLLSKYSPRKYSSNYELHGSATSESTSGPAAEPSSRAAEVAKSRQSQNKVNREANIMSLPSLDVEKAIPQVDSKLSSPNHIASQAAANVEPRKSSSKPSSTQEKQSVVLSKQVEAEPKPNVLEHAIRSTVRENLSRTLVSVGDKPTDAYAMLYDDIEPDAIGVAKTSNVPIHSSTPSTSIEPRPWTPNRGITTTIVSSSPIIANDPRSNLIPASLRIDKPDTTKITINGVVQHRLEPSKPITANSTDDSNLDKPINPEELYDRTKPRESPTIPKLYNQPISSSLETHKSLDVAQIQPSPESGQNKSASEEVKEREFAALMDRKEPVKYTLTPDEIRDADPYRRRDAASERKDVHIDITRKGSGNSTGSAQMARLVLSQSEGPPSPKQPMKISDIRKAISALSPEPIEPLRSRRSGLLARDPRVAGGETRDFVDFVRSCAPASTNQTQPAALFKHVIPGGSSANVSPLRRHSTKRHMTARDSNCHPDGNDDLLAFIRTGPSGGASNSTGARQERDPGSYLPRKDSYAATALAMNINKPLPDPRASSLSNSQPQIIRKTRRAKDPYAISDEEDEDEDEDKSLASSKKGSEFESIAEFLRSTSPPPITRSNTVTYDTPTPQPLTHKGSISFGRFRTSTSETPKDKPGGPLPDKPAKLNSRGKSGSISKSSSLLRKKLEARPAGATRGFGGHGFYHSTNDLADYLRSSGPRGNEPHNNSLSGGPIFPASNSTSRPFDGINGLNGASAPIIEGGLKKSSSTRKSLWSQA